MTYTPSDYKLIVMWNPTSYAYYIKAQQTLAAQDQAPLDSLYKNNEGKWVRLGDIANVELRNELILRITKKMVDAY